MPIAARSAPNNGQVKEAKVSSCTRGTGKAVNGKGKRGNKTDVDRRTTGDEKGDVKQAKHRNVRQTKRGDKNKNIKRNGDKSRRKYNFRLWEITKSYKG